MLNLYCDYNYKMHGYSTSLLLIYGLLANNNNIIVIIPSINNYLFGVAEVYSEHEITAVAICQ